MFSVRVIAGLFGGLCAAAQAEDATLAVAGLGEIIYDNETAALISATPSIVVLGLLALFVAFFVINLSRWAFGVIEHVASGDGCSEFSELPEDAKEEYFLAMDDSEREVILNRYVK